MNTAPVGVPEAAFSTGTGTYEMKEGVPFFVQWKKPSGAPVGQDEEIAIVELDKVEIIITAPAAGTFMMKTAETEWSWNGETVATLFGTLFLPLLGEIKTEAGGQREDLSMPPAPLVESHGQEDSVSAWEHEGGNGATRATPLAAKIAERNGIDLSVLPGSGVGGRIVASDVERASREEGVRAVPAARVFAREHSIDLASIKGSGPDGVILVEDVRNAMPVSVGTASPPALRTSTLRKTIARKMEKSALVPHGRERFTTDVTHLFAFLAAYREYGAPFSGIPFRLDYIFAWYAVQLLKTDEFKTASVYWDKETKEIVALPHINMGVVVNTPRGAIIPVVHNAEKDSFTAFAARLHVQVEKVKTGTEALADLLDLTFTVNNTGALGGEEPNSLLPYPSCTEGCKADDRERPTAMMINLPKVWEESGRKLLRLTVTFDHRPFDGALPTAFAKALRALIEEKGHSRDFAEDLAG